MKLIEEIGLISYTQRNGTIQKNKSGKFECPHCHKHVIRPLSKGGRNNSCGNKECVKATRKKDIAKGPDGYRRKHKIGDLAPSNKKSKLHGLYQVWSGMKKRCYDRNQPKYKNYQNKGIIVCEQWKDSFDNFYSDMGEEYLKLKEEANGVRALVPSIDRIDNDGPYSPENCQWITYGENSSKDLRIPVVRLDMENNILASYISATHASQSFVSAMGCEMISPSAGNILACCRGTKSKHVGYKWAFATDKQRMQK